MAPGQKLTQGFEPLCRYLDSENIDPRQVATRPGDTGNKAKLYRAVFEHDKTGGVAARPRQALDEAGARLSNAAVGVGQRAPPRRLPPRADGEIKSHLRFNYGRYGQPNSTAITMKQTFCKDTLSSPM
jgi:hypothetical protein